MLGTILQRLTEIERRLANILLVGAIIDADYEKALVKVAVGKLETGWLPWITTRANTDIDYWAPEINEQVLLMSPGGDPELGVVLPALYQANFPATDIRPSMRRVKFADGADFSYDREAKALTISLPEGATTTLVSAGGISMTGDTVINGNVQITGTTAITGATTMASTLSVTGDITGGGNIKDSTRSMSADRGLFNGHTHTSGQPGLPTTTPGTSQ